MRDKQKPKESNKRTRTRLQGQQAKAKDRKDEQPREGTYMEEREKISRYAG